MKEHLQDFPSQSSLDNANSTNNELYFASIRLVIIFKVRDSLVAQMVKNPPARQETQAMVQFLGWEDPLEKEMATPSSILV